MEGGDGVPRRPLFRYHLAVATAVPTEQPFLAPGTDGAAAGTLLSGCHDWEALPPLCAACAGESGGQRRALGLPPAWGLWF